MSGLLDQCATETGSRKYPKVFSEMEQWIGWEAQTTKHLGFRPEAGSELAPRYSHELALVYEREQQRGNKNGATLAVASKMVSQILGAFASEVARTLGIFLVASRNLEPARGRQLSLD